jgi:hypothetical protein
MIKLLSFKKNAVWVWSFKLNEEEHSLRLQESNVSGKRVITLDDKPILEIAPKFLDVGSEHRFQVSGVPCMLEIGSNGLTFTHKLWVNRRLVPVEK